MSSSEKHAQSSRIGFQRTGLLLSFLGFIIALIGAVGAGSIYPKLFFLASLCFIAIGSLFYFSVTYFSVPAGIRNNRIMFDSLSSRGGIGFIIALALIAFYILMYWFPDVLKHFIAMFHPLSRMLRGKPAEQYFMYGSLYTFTIIIMGARAIMKYRHSRYQIVRTSVVIFSQLVFAFLIPSILAAFNEPEKYVNYFWPLSYKDLFPSNVNYLLNFEGAISKFLLAWTILLTFVGTPVLTFFFGKRWYCSWICGCGGLANTLGDPWRQLSSKTLVSWKIERYSIYSVLSLIVITTAILWLNHLFGGELLGQLGHGFSSFYGFAIGMIFAGVIGTGLYPIFGTRVWCRFGCPQAAILGIIQRFFSRFRITTNGAQCMSCGNCSTYCEMGIDVRWYAQRGQNIVRASCVGCGICSTVCPRGVLNLENGPLAGRIKSDALPLIKPFKSGI